MSKQLRGQLTIAFMIGILLLILLSIFLLTVRQKSVEEGISEKTTEGIIDVEAEEELEILTNRLESCGGRIVEQALEQTLDEENMEKQLITYIQEHFSTCYHEFNTAGDITSEGVPKINVHLQEGELLAIITPQSTVAYNKKRYVIPPITINKQTPLTHMRTVIKKTIAALEDPAEYGSPQGYITPTGAFDPFAEENYTATLKINKNHCVFSLSKEETVVEGETEECAIA